MNHERMREDEKCEENGEKYLALTIAIDVQALQTMRTRTLHAISRGQYIKVIRFFARLNFRPTKGL